VAATAVSSNLWAVCTAGLPPIPLPPPLQRIDLKRTDVLRLPAHQLPSVRQFVKVFRPQWKGLIEAAPHDNRTPAVTPFGEENSQRQFPGRMTNFDLPPLFPPGKPIFHLALDIEVLNIAPLFRRTQRNDYIPAVAFPIAIHHQAGLAPVVGENPALAPDVVLEGEDMVLCLLSSE
jgi:hypothetical protein